VPHDDSRHTCPVSWTLNADCVAGVRDEDRAAVSSHHRLRARRQAYSFRYQDVMSGISALCVTFEVVTMPVAGRSWIAGRDRGKVGGIAESFPIAFGDFGVAYFVETHLIEAPVVIISMHSVRSTLLGW
jgi:hypothetical protein